MVRSSIVLFIVAILATSACKKESAPPPAADQHAESAHAPANAKPGSYEDWCDEHGVPESQCTLCHPDLIAAFKATGDWCEEHTLPKSHCKKCNPNLVIERGKKTN